MPAEPKKKHSKARKRTRRASIKLGKANLVICQNCGKMAMPHQICQNCGFYKGVSLQAKKKVQVVKA